MSKCGLCGAKEMARHSVLRCRVPLNAGVVEEIEDWMLTYSEFEGCENVEAAAMLRDACTLLHSIATKAEEFIQNE